MIPIVEAMVTEIKASRKQSVSTISTFPSAMTVNTINVSPVHDHNDNESNWADDVRVIEKVRRTLLLSVAYAANIGGKVHRAKVEGDRTSC